MGTDAKAYVWFGTKPLDERPGFIPADWDEQRGLDERLAAKGLQLVNVPDPGGDGLWALAVLKTYHHYDGDVPAEKFDMVLPTKKDIERLRNEAISLGLDFVDRELGWYMGATY